MARVPRNRPESTATVARLDMPGREGSSGMGEGYRLHAARASSSVQPDFEAFVVALRPRLSGGLLRARDDTTGTRSERSCRRTEQKGDAEMSTGTPHLQVDASGVPPTLLFLVLVL